MTNGNGPIDATPTNGSSNPVSSDGVYDALQQYVTIGTAQSITGSKTYDNDRLRVLLNADTTTVAGSYQESHLSFYDANGIKIAEVRRDRLTNDADRMIMSLFKYKSSTRTDSANLDLRMESDGTVNIVVRKTINGTTTQSTIATL